MPRPSCWFLRASLAYLVVGFTLGALLLADKGLGFAPLLIRTLPIHMEILVVGWLVQFAMGGAYWLFPRFRLSAPALGADTRRGNENLAWLAFGLLNLGIGWVVAEAILGMPGLIWVGRIAESAGVLAFVLGVWRRVKPFQKLRVETKEKL